MSQKSNKIELSKNKIDRYKTTKHAFRNIFIFGFTVLILLTYFIGVSFTE